MKSRLQDLNSLKTNEEEMKKLRIFFLFSYVVLTMFFIGCESSKTGLTTSNKVVCVLFDLSETTNTPEIRKTYRDKFRMILEKINHGDVIEAALITEKSVSELNLSIEHSFPAFEPSTDNEMLAGAERKNAKTILKSLKDSLLKVADSILFNPPREIMNTEILSSLLVAERVITSFPHEKKIIVIFSDMIEESHIANFAKENLSDLNIKTIIKKLKKNGSLPELQNAVIYVAGATHPNSEKYNAIRKFWIKYFEETGAVLKPQNYGAALIRFDE